MPSSGFLSASRCLKQCNCDLQAKICNLISLPTVSVNHYPLKWYWQCITQKVVHCLLLFHVSARVIKFQSYANDKVMMITFSRPNGLERIPQKGGGLNVEWKTKRNGKLTVKILRGFPLFSCHLPCSLLKSAHEDFHFSVFIGHRKIGESTW